MSTNISETSDLTLVKIQLLSIEFDSIILQYTRFSVNLQNELLLVHDQLTNLALLLPRERIVQH